MLTDEQFPFVLRVNTEGFTGLHCVNTTLEYIGVSDGEISGTVSAPLNVYHSVIMLVLDLSWILHFHISQP